MTTYRITFARPSRSKCPNAWAKIEGADEWMQDGAVVAHGTKIVIGGNVRRATRVEKVVEHYTVDEAGTWAAWAGCGEMTFSAVA